MQKNLQDHDQVLEVHETKVAQLYSVLGDYAWHTTQELVRGVGHTFAVAKYKLVRLGYFVGKRRDPGAVRNWLYRLDPPRRFTRRGKHDIQQDR